MNIPDAELVTSEEFMDSLMPRFSAFMESKFGLPLDAPGRMSKDLSIFLNSELEVRRYESGLKDLEDGNVKAVELELERYQTSVARNLELLGGIERVFEEAVTSGEEFGQEGAEFLDQLLWIGSRVRKLIDGVQRLSSEFRTRSLYVSFERGLEEMCGAISNEEKGAFQILGERDSIYRSALVQKAGFDRRVAEQLAGLRGAGDSTPVILAGRVKAFLASPAPSAVNRILAARLVDLQRGCRLAVKELAEGVFSLFPALASHCLFFYLYFNLCEPSRAVTRKQSTRLLDPSTSLSSSNPPAQNFANLFDLASRSAEQLSAPPALSAAPPRVAIAARRLAGWRNEAADFARLASLLPFFAEARRSAAPRADVR